jgi:hypothetical protein
MNSSSAAIWQSCNSVGLGTAMSLALERSMDHGDVRRGGGCCGVVVAEAELQSLMDRK